jgi:hypothetical protein
VHRPGRTSCATWFAGSTRNGKTWSRWSRNTPCAHRSRQVGCVGRSSRTPPVPCRAGYQQRHRHRYRPTGIGYRHRCTGRGSSIWAPSPSKERSKVHRIASRRGRAHCEVRRFRLSVDCPPRCRLSPRLWPSRSPQTKIHKYIRQIEFLNNRIDFYQNIFSDFFLNFFVEREFFLVQKTNNSFDVGQGFPTTRNLERTRTSRLPRQAARRNSPSANRSVRRAYLSGPELKVRRLSETHR